MAIPPATGRPKCVVVQPHGWDARILHRYGVRIFCREFSLSAGRHSLAVAFGNRHSRNFSLDWILPQEIHSQPKQGCCDRGLEKCWAGGADARGVPQPSVEAVKKLRA